MCYTIWFNFVLNEPKSVLAAGGSISVSNTTRASTNNPSRILRKLRTRAESVEEAASCASGEPQLSSTGSVRSRGSARSPDQASATIKVTGDTLLYSSADHTFSWQPAAAGPTWRILIGFRGLLKELVLLWLQLIQLDSPLLWTTLSLLSRRIVNEERGPRWNLTVEHKKSYFTQEIE